MPALMLAGDGLMIARAREAFLEIMRDEQYAAERTVMMNAAAARYERMGRSFARN